MDPPDATGTFLGASPFADYLRELSSQDIADRASSTITSQNRLASPIALTIASCLDDPIADDRLDDERLIVLPVSSFCRSALPRSRLPSGRRTIASHR